MEIDKERAGRSVKVLGDRWEVVVNLLEKEMNATQIAQKLGVKLPAVSKMMKELSDADLVVCRAEPSRERGGVRKYYTLTPYAKLLIETAMGKSVEREEYTKEELEILKPHWENIKQSMLYLLSPYLGRDKKYDIDVALKYMPDLEGHLESGYHQIYELYDEWCKKREEKAEKEKMLKEKTFKEVEKEFGDTISGYKYREAALTNLSELVIERMRCMLTNSSLWMDEDRSWEEKEGELWCGGRLLPPRNREEVKEALKKISQNEELKRLHEEVFKLEDEVYKLKTSLDKELTLLIKRVESGLPLRGYCNTCSDRPKVKG